MGGREGDRSSFFGLSSLYIQMTLLTTSSHNQDTVLLKDFRVIRCVAIRCYSHATLIAHVCPSVRWGRLAWPGPVRRALNALHKTPRRSFRLIIKRCFLPPRRRAPDRASLQGKPQHQ